jgi:mannan endo-1,4-beta-mannosidase
MGETDWYTNKLLKSILFDEQTRQISYVMVWRNDNPEHFHVPYPGHPSVPDFIEFYNSPFTIFMSDINKK